MFLFHSFAGGYIRGNRDMESEFLWIWRERSGSSSNCFFSIMYPSKHRASKNVHAIIYPDFLLSIDPVPHCSDFRVPSPSKEENSNSVPNDVINPDYRGGAEVRHPYFLNQNDLNDQIRDRGLTMSNSDVLDVEFQAVKFIRWMCACHRPENLCQSLSSYFPFQYGLLLFHDVTDLFKSVWITCNPIDCRLSSYSSLRILKAMLFHINIYPSLSMTHSVQFKVECSSFRILQDALKYEEYGLLETS